MALFPPVSMKNHSGSITEGGTAQWLFEQNERPKAYFMFQNTSDTDMYLDFSDDLATEENGILIAPGVAYEPPAGVIFDSRASVLCATTDKTFVCKTA